MGISIKSYTSSTDTQEFLLSYYFHINGILQSTATVEQWFNQPYEITELYTRKFSNADKAAKLRNSKLRKVLE